MYIVLFAKFYYGIRWICKGHKRRDFVPYYMLVISYGGAAIANNIMLCFVNAEDELYKEYNVFIYLYNYIAFSIIQMIIVALYMKFLDDQRILQNNILRDK